jgi:hypothetical protein
MTIEQVKQTRWFMWAVIGLYIGAIVVANASVTIYGQVALPFCSFALIPFDLISRDILQDRWQGHSAADLRFRMTLVIMAGAVISVLTGTGSARINLASFLAFMVAGAIDALTYQWMIRYGRIFRINAATLTAAITDSIIFVLIAFDHTVWSLILFQVAMKVAGGFCWSLLLYRFFRRKDESTKKVGVDDIGLTIEVARLLGIPIWDFEKVTISRKLTWEMLNDVEKNIKEFKKNNPTAKVITITADGRVEEVK